MPVVKEMQKLKVKSKIGIVTHPQNSMGISKKRLGFYIKYASVVLKTLKKPLFLKFLSWIIKKENIEEDRVEAVQVMVFPFRKKNGNGLAGRCTSKGEIFIYPKRLNFFRKMMQNCKKQKIYLYLKSRAMATLIHELLHLKYSKEEKVRELTEKYFNTFIKHQSTQNPDIHSVVKMLFSN